MKIAFFDAKPYDKIWFDKLVENYPFRLKYYENRLEGDTAVLARGCSGAIAFVNDTIDAAAIDALYNEGVRVIAMRSAGYNNIDFKHAFGKVHVLRVPAYSPNAVAEYAIALLLMLIRKTHRAYGRTRDHNFNINGLQGINLYGRTIGIVGTGKIGRIFIDICKGFGMEVVAYDPFPAKDTDIRYVTFEELCRISDIISLHCPLTKETHHIVNKKSIADMKDGAILVNTSRGALIDSGDLLAALKSKKLQGAALDVYEEETDLFFEDFSGTIIDDDTLTMLLSLPNVLITSHQAFLTDEALQNIAETTLDNLKAFFDGAPLANEICYRCVKEGTCRKDHVARCF
ncbi:2-hydroxyacid dehydrogenase [Christensenellaceae bacterium OttesenSCG-928-K19]|nr:2-hydroxyacid dehydrogenase [Christensenellaceae bacterium OttesenSCG-928-K19]